MRNMKKLFNISLLLIVLLSLFISSSIGPQNILETVGESVTLLPDGRWLRVGGEGPSSPLATASIWDALTGTTTSLNELQHARSRHSATMLPDGTVLVLGGLGPDGKVVDVAELFNPDSQAFQSLPTTGLTPRARHTATLLTDGRVLITGGTSSEGKILGLAELLDPSTQQVTLTPQPLNTARHSHSTTILPDGSVLLWGGVGEDGNAVQSGEIYDPGANIFTPIQTLPSADADTPEVTGSLPQDGTVNVPVETVIGLRFSKPLRVETINPETFTLTGPQGIETIKVVPGEGGRLAFVTPDSALLSGSSYTLSINGLLDRDGLLLPLSGLRFTTTSGSAIKQSTTTTSEPASGSSSSSTESTATALTSSDDDWEWKGEWRDGKPHSAWQDLPPLQAGSGVTALAGQVLRLNGEPLANVTLQIGEYGSETVTAKTDETGRFLLKNIMSGWCELLIDGRTAGPSRKTYGIFEVGMDIKSGQTNVLPYTIWMAKIDTAHAVRISSPTTSEVVVTTPKIPGLELRIPPNTVIRDHEGNIVTEVSLTPIPVDRPPFPLPNNVQVPVYFTAQPGGAYIYGPSGARVIYPNDVKELPGARFNFWHYDPEGSGWYIYGMGTVTEDGKQIVPDPGVSIYEFTGAMINSGNSPSANQTKCRTGEKCTGGEPVDLTTGLFVMEKTDLFLPDILPLKLTRTYVTGDTNARPFGVGMTHPYAIFLWSALQYQEADLILPNQGRIHYVRTSPGTGFTDAVFEHRAPDAGCPTCVGSPTIYYGSKIVWNGNGWDLTLKDGTVYVFGENAPLQSIRDRNGNQITLTRTSGQSGNITKVTSPNGRWIEFTYNAINRITQVKDNIGRTVTYTYDGSGRLYTVTDPNGGVTTYTYDTSHRMLTIRDARNIVFLTNEYDANGRVFRQTQADTTTFQFAYTLNGSTVTQTDLTDPRGKVRRVTFDSSSYPLTDTLGLGTLEAQAITYERETGTNFVLSVTDALVINSQNRKTSYLYDPMGNVASVTRMAQDPPNAVTTTFTYEPTFNQVTSITDPLSHTTNFGRDAKGNLTSVTNPLNQTTTIAYNTAGQPISVTDPLNSTTQFTYDFGDLVAVTDPLGNSTTRFIDGAGRLMALTNPLGNLTLYDYDVLNRLTKVADPLNGWTQFGYDPNGNLLSVTDAKNGVTVYTYNNMDRLATRTDPLLRPESYLYDNNGNLGQFTDRKSQVSTYTYDALNRRTGVTYAGPSTTAYTYDKGNRLTQIVDSISGTITRTYDGLDRPTSETTPQGSVSYPSDNAGRRTSMTVAGQPTINYFYDNANRVTQITQGSSVVLFGYDAAGRRTSLTLPNGILVEYAYDAASRVTSITYKKGANVLGNLTHEYDKAGNRTKIGGSFARTGHPQAITSTAYNAANHQTTFGEKTLAYDNNGNLTSITNASGTTLYTWNTRNQLTGISGPGVTASFVYDGLGRREKKTINGSLTEFLFDGVNPVQETSGATVLANILPGLGIDEIFSRTDVPTATTRHFLPDALGSTLALSDSAGAVQTQYTYEPFGRTTVTGASNGNPFQYTGRENDGTGLYYYRARYYHPGLQRFISEDPIEFEGGDINLYAYVGNSSVDLTDPNGEAMTVPLPPGCRPNPPPDGGRKNPAGADSNGRNPLLDALRDFYCDPNNAVPGPAMAKGPVNPFKGADALRRSNKAANDALRQALKEAGVPYSADLREQFHRYITGQGIESFQRLVGAAREFVSSIIKR